MFKQLEEKLQRREGKLPIRLAIRTGLRANDFKAI